MCPKFSCVGSLWKFGHSQVVSPVLSPEMPYAIVATTCAMPMRPSMSSGDTSMVSDLERVNPTVMRPKQSSVSSVGDLSA